MRRGLFYLPLILFNFLALVCLIILLAPGTAEARSKIRRYGESYCGSLGYRCFVVQPITVEKKVSTRKGYRAVTRTRSPSWEELFPDEREREIVMRINRVNIRPQLGMVLAVPRNMEGRTFMDFSPFPKHYSSAGQKTLIFDPAKLAFAAYDEQGILLRWGPAVGGKDYCPDAGARCRTPEGTFKMTRKQGRYYRSGKYPLGCEGGGCAPMPYAMFFAKGVAFHAGSLPGYHASHGCIRVFYEDSEWLHREFVEIGTAVNVTPYSPKPVQQPTIAYWMSLRRQAFD